MFKSPDIHQKNAEKLNEVLALAENMREFYKRLEQVGKDGDCIAQNKVKGELVECRVNAILARKKKEKEMELLKASGWK